MLYIILDDHIYTVSAKNKELSIGLTSIISKINIDTYNTLLLLISIDNFAYAVNFILYILILHSPLLLFFNNFKNLLYLII